MCRLLLITCFLTPDNGIVAASVQEYADRPVTAAVHLVSLTIGTKRQSAVCVVILFASGEQYKQISHAEWLDAGMIARNTYRGLQGDSG